MTNALSQAASAAKAELLIQAAITLRGLFNSIMFPTIFSMGLHKLGNLIGQGFARWRQ